MKRRVLPVLLMMLMVFSTAMPAFAADSNTIVFAGHMAGTNGKMAYFAVGIDGGGTLYSYNSSTKVKKKIANGKWAWINVKGKYLYLTKNNYGGSDGRNYYIYRMKKNGKGKKKLANGSDCVVKGKYIYYIGYKKTKMYGRTVDGAQLGIYRMKLNGKGKKRLVKAGNNEYFGELGVTSNGLVFTKNGTWYKSSLKGKNIRTINLYDYYSNINKTVDYSYYDDFDSATMVGNSKAIYYSASGAVYRYSGASDKRITSVSGTVMKIIVSGNHMMVISRAQSGYNYYYHAYMMKKNGKNKKQVRKGVEVSGGWDY